MLRRSELSTTGSRANAGAAVARSGTGAIARNADAGTDANANANADADADANANANANAGTADAGGSFKRIELRDDVVGRTHDRYNAESVSSCPGAGNFSRRIARDHSRAAAHEDFERPDQSGRSNPQGATGKSLSRSADSAAQDGYRQLAERQDRPEDHRTRRSGARGQYHRPHSHTREAWQQ
jgi:hypothetical protein